MDLDSLRDEFKLKHHPIVIILMVLTLLVMMGAIVYHVITDTYESQIWMIISIIVFSFATSFWFVWIIYASEKKKKNQISYIYTKLVNRHNLEHNRSYQVDMYKDIPKNFLKRFPLFRFTLIRYSLYMVDHITHHQLLFVRFYQSNGKTTTLKSSGLLYTYPITKKVRAEHVIEQIDDETLKRTLKPVRLGEHFMIYQELKDDIPVFIKFKESEKDKVLTFASEVFKFFDTINDLF